MPEISVIVPIYKAEAYLHRCIDSILAQFFTNFELILVDDGSPDRCGAICDEYAAIDQRVRVIHKPNGGVSSARNAGIDVASGQYLTFVDSDDYVSRQYLTDLYKPEYDLTVIGHLHYEDANDRTISKELVSFQTDRLDADSFTDALSRNGKYWLIFCWGRLYNREIIKQNHIRFDEALRLGEDYVFSAEYLAHCSSLCMGEETSYIHVDRSETLSKTFDIPFFKHLLRSEEMVAAVFKNRFGIADIQKSQEELCAIFADALGAIASCSDFSFCKKYQILKYLFKEPHFIEAIDYSDIYFKDVSGLYKTVLKIKSPLIMLCALTVRIKSGRKADEK